MFTSIHLGDDQYSDFLKKQREKEMEEEKDEMERITKIESSCDQIIRILGRMQDDINSLERKLDVHNESVKSKMIEICDIVEEINDTLTNR